MLVYFTMVSRSRTQRSYWQPYPTHVCLLHHGIQVQNSEKLLAALSNPCLFTSPWYLGPELIEKLLAALSNPCLFTSPWYPSPELREAIGSLIQPMLVYFTLVSRSRTQRSYWQPYPTHACLLHLGIQVQNSEKLLAALSNPCLFTSPWYPGPELIRKHGMMCHHPHKHHSQYS